MEWYSSKSFSDVMEQGDFVGECPIIRPPEVLDEQGEYELEIDLINAIILSQSCDLVNNKIDIVLVCPYITLEEFRASLSESERGKKAFQKHVDNLKKGYLPGYHLLNKFEDLNLLDYIVVDFRNVYGIHINNLRSLVKKKETRISLNSPYREHLSQAFARYFMRVGLPQDLVIEIS